MLLVFFRFDIFNFHSSFVFTQLIGASRFVCLKISLTRCRCEVFYVPKLILHFTTYVGLFAYLLTDCERTMCNIHHIYTTANY